PHRRRTGKNQKGKSEGCPLAFERAKGLANAPAPTAVRLRRRRRTSNSSKWTGALVSPAKYLVLGKHFQYKRNIAGKAKKFSFATRGFGFLRRALGRLARRHRFHGCNRLQVLSPAQSVSACGQNGAGDLLY